jgi:hypothetical protein
MVTESLKLGRLDVKQRRFRLGGEPRLIVLGEVGRICGRP